MSPSGYSLDQYHSTHLSSHWKLAAADEFTIPAPTGSWGTSSSSKVVYTGDHGTQWVEYPDGWKSTYTNGLPGYEPSKVLSVHDGVLDYNLANIGGFAQGANPSPILTGASRYQVYGKYVVRARFDKVAGYHIAWLLWPNVQSLGGQEESDFPEFNMSPGGSVSAFAHYGGSSQDAFHYAVDTTKWHTYEQIWKPGSRSYYVDGQPLGTSFRNHTVPCRWQLQTEPSGHAPGGSGHILVDWVAVYSYSVV